MEYAISVSLSGDKKIVTADGKEINKVDASVPSLLIVPDLYLPTEQIPPGSVDLNEIRLSIECDKLNLPTFSLHQPYPNPGYIVAGGEDRKIGLFLEMPIDLKNLRLIYWWSFAKSSIVTKITGIVTIEHTIKINLIKCDRGKVFSTRLPYYEPNQKKLTSVLFSEDFDRFIGKNNDTCIKEDRNDLEIQLLSQKKEQRILSLRIEQSANISSCALSDLPFLEFNDRTLFRDIEQQSEFDTGTEEHRSAASIRIPEQVLVRAISMARSIPFDLYEKNAELHPAFIVLSNWWNNNASPDYQCAASCVLWVRINSNLEYFPGYYEDPTVGIELFEPASTANCGDAILIIFLKSKSTAYYDENNWASLESVDGEIYESAGMVLEEFDPAWYSLQALKEFPERFPEAWSKIFLEDRFSTKLT